MTEGGSPDGWQRTLQEIKQVEILEFAASNEIIIPIGRMNPTLDYKLTGVLCYNLKHDCHSDDYLCIYREVCEDLKFDETLPITVFMSLGL